MQSDKQFTKRLKTDNEMPIGYFSHQAAFYNSKNKVHCSICLQPNLKLQRDS